jgi:hypothetical protein
MFDSEDNFAHRREQDERRARARKLTELLCEEAWQGRWKPLGIENIRPLAEHTAQVIVDAERTADARKGDAG